MLYSIGAGACFDMPGHVCKEAPIAPPMEQPAAHRSRLCRTPRQHRLASFSAGPMCRRARGRATRPCAWPGRSAACRSASSWTCSRVPLVPVEPLAPLARPACPTSPTRTALSSRRRPLPPFHPLCVPLCPCPMSSLPLLCVRSASALCPLCLCSVSALPLLCVRSASALYPLSPTWAASGPHRTAPITDTNRILKHF